MIGTKMGIMPISVGKVGLGPMIWEPSCVLVRRYSRRIRRTWERGFVGEGRRDFNVMRGLEDRFERKF